MTDQVVAISPANKSLALAEALDFPTLDLVRLSPDNPLLVRLATAESIEESIWRDFSHWMEATGSPEQRLRELRRDYYYLFLRAERDISVYLHDWYKDLPAHELLSGLRQFLDSVKLSKAGGFRSGQDHISLVLEALAHLSLANPGEAIRFHKLYVEPWFGVFASRLGSEARSPFYLAAAKLAGGLERDLETLV
ncbi:MAG: hypothetical protein BMS9Abin37_0510 [Acidobacteriota bacterium]|nr:MAG: hypothetical protein BMS9Abin37_0510 [Acidobacteriota bacterium]